MKPLHLRIEEIKNIYLQLEQLGLDDRFDAIVNFKKLANSYVKDGIGSNGVMPINSINRVLCYRFSEKEDVPCDIVLRFKKY